MVVRRAEGAAKARPAGPTRDQERHTRYEKALCCQLNTHQQNVNRQTRGADHQEHNEQVLVVVDQHASVRRVHRTVSERRLPGVRIHVWRLERRIQTIASSLRHTEQLSLYYLHAALVRG